MKNKSCQIDSGIKLVVGSVAGVPNAGNTLGMLLVVSLPICTTIGGPEIDFWSGVKKGIFQKFQLIADSGPAGC